MTPTHGLVSTSTPQAVAAGVELFAEGGNAVDAALAAAAALVVTEPTGNGLGADAFGIVGDANGGIHGLNASGRCALGTDAETLRQSGLTAMPVEGWLPVTVPGMVSGWFALHERFGALPFARALEPAIRLAREGFDVPPRIAEQWRAGGERRFGGREGFAAFGETWLVPEVDGTRRAPRAGERFVNAPLADSLELIARRGRAGFYETLAERIVTHARDTGGALDIQDFRRHRADWVQPVAVRYRDATIHELPPSGQGIVASLALRIAEGMPHAEDEAILCADRLHRLAESLRQAIASGHRHIADPDCMRIRVEDLLDDSNVARLRSRIRPDTVDDDPDAQPGSEPGTVYLATADASGLVVSWIQSCYMGFGSGVVVPGTGISMQNRGCGFSLERGHPNELAPGKRPFHTIIPGFLETDRERIAFGVMGGPMQPQGHVQVVTALLDHRLSPQEACALPRFRVLDGREICLEDGIPEATRAQLTARGHQIVEQPGQWAFGGAQMACLARDGTLSGGSDPRKDGCTAFA